MGLEVLAAPAGRTAIWCEPAGRLIGFVTVLNWKSDRAFFPSTYTSTGVFGMPCTTVTVAVEAADAGRAASPAVTAATAPAASTARTVVVLVALMTVPFWTRQP